MTRLGADHVPDNEAVPTPSSGCTHVLKGKANYDHLYLGIG